MKGNPAVGPLLVVTTIGPVEAPSGTVVEIVVAVEFEITALAPLNVIEFVLVGEVNPVPVTVTEVPTIAGLGDTAVTVGEATTVKAKPLLAGSPGTVTTTFPDDALAGSIAQIVFGLQEYMVTAFPCNVTVLPPDPFPKLLP